MDNDLKTFIQQLDIDRELLLKFFIVFSRCEYALKRSGFTNGQDGVKVEPNWDKYIKLLKADFNADRTDELKAAVDYLENNPPKKQILSKSKLAWCEQKMPQNRPQLFWLLDLVKTVRNNLFHGAKYPHAEIQDPARNKLLLESSLLILLECLELSKGKCPKMVEHFYDYVP
jgi:hypothetical protein